MEVLEEASTLEAEILRQSTQMKIPANGSIEITPLCNMNCDMCYVRLSPAEMKQQGRLRSGAEWLRLGQEMKQAGVLFLLITGGEPLLHPDFREIYLGMRKLGMIVTINTNATLIDEEWAEFFGAYPPRRINITLYGADDNAYRSLCHYPGGFEQTVNAIRLLRRHGVDVKVASSLTKANQQDWEKVIRIGEELGVPVREDTYMCPATRERSRPFQEQVRMNPEDAAEVRVKLLQREMGEEIFRKSAALELQKAQAGPRAPGDRSMRCLAGSCSFSVNWQGMMRPCVIATEPQADVFSMGFVSAWNHIVTETKKLLISTQCASCQLREVCDICAYYALYECGRSDGVPAYLCRYTRETLRQIQNALTAIGKETSE